jgi:hypothetical protein
MTDRKREREREREGEREREQPLLRGSLFIKHLFDHKHEKVVKNKPCIVARVVILKIGG